MEKLKRQDDQWIPWEISYSLRTQIRNKRRSIPNALIAVVLPDIEDSYEYFLTYWSYEDKNNEKCVVESINNSNTFDIIKNNMFNQKNPSIERINGRTVYYGESSYMITVKWKDFIIDTDKYINKALGLRDKIGDYIICKKIIKDS
ncbi:hypothetical protein [Limosilactobacillus caviae]|nr:hypothetical protein [Limosilactobacillus caviae]MCD7124055.1 hypothetical protein [Limosilactobacillus caviae]